MSVALVTTAGSASANSYVTVVQATAYLAGRLDVAEWTAAGVTSPETQSVALVMAATRMNQAAWAGRIADSAQALAWPRQGAYDRDGYAYASDAVPQSVKNAQVELALALLKTTDLLDDTGLASFERLKVGPIDMTLRERSTGGLPDNVRREISHLLVSASSYGFHMQRG